jgi:hypothetical protein
VTLEKASAKRRAFSQIRRPNVVRFCAGFRTPATTI